LYAVMTSWAVTRTEFQKQAADVGRGVGQADMQAGHGIRPAATAS
jgi:hypothetical protein